MTVTMFVFLVAALNLVRLHKPSCDACKTVQAVGREKCADCHNDDLDQL